MRSILSNSCVSALLFSALVIASPAVAAGAGGTVSGNIGAGAANGAAGTTIAGGSMKPRTTSTADGRSTSTVGMSTNGDTGNTGNNAGSVDTTAQTPAHVQTSAHRMAKKAHAKSSANVQ